MNHALAARLGAEAVRISYAGQYMAGGHVVSIDDQVRRAAAATQTFGPDQSVPLPQPGTWPMPVSVANETTLEAAARLVANGKRVLALNFASPSHPGGGFLNGALAQEETLARSSALYRCLEGSPMYAYRREHRDPIFADFVIYSPDVPVFRTDGGDLLVTPYLCSFITSPAVHRGNLLVQDPRRECEILPAMQSRIRKVLSVAALHPHDALLLGAWGCGAFQNSPELIAELFRTALSGVFRGVFPAVHFAVYDRRADRRQIKPFEAQFA
jgi:uncharacterized protein (TIGR02452 family)